MLGPHGHKIKTFADVYYRKRVVDQVGQDWGNNSFAKLKSLRTLDLIRDNLASRASLETPVLVPLNNNKLQQDGVSIHQESC